MLYPRACVLLTLWLMGLTPAACQRKPAQNMKDRNFAGVVNAPDFPVDGQWLNTERPLSLRDLRGKIVLLDFWTYCCINCIHILPELKKLERKYPELVVIGVHSAKFNNEQDAENIRSAIVRYDIEHPVYVDNDFYLWKQYAVNAWPSFVIIDPKGKVYGRSSGEGIYEPFDSIIAGMSAQFAAKGEVNKTPLAFSLEKYTRPGSYLSYPGKVEADATGKRLFITDSNHNRIIVTNPEGDIIDIIGNGAEGAADGDYATATFFRPQGLAYDARADVLYVADTENHLLRKVDLKRKLVTTLAGTGQQSRRYLDRGRGRELALNSPWDLTLLNGKLYIAMAGPHQIWEMDTETAILERYAGSGAENLVDGPRLEAALAQPSGLTTDGQVLYFADSEVSGIRRVDDKNVTTLAGEGLFEFGDIDGKFPDSRLQHAIGVLYHEGRLLVADTYNHRLKQLNPADKTLKRWLGDGKRGYRDGNAAQARFNEPNDIAYLAGKYYITDTNNDLIRVYDPVTDLVSTFQFRNPERLSLLESRPASAEGLVALTSPLYTLSSPAVTGMPVQVEITLPRGFAFNDAAPHYAVLRGQRLKPAVSSDKLAFSLPAMQGTDAELELGIYFCESDNKARCFIKQYRLKLPLAASGAGRVDWQAVVK